VRAPHAEGLKKGAMKKIAKGKKVDEVEPLLAHLFRDRQNNRTWYVRKLRLRAGRMIASMACTSPSRMRKATS